MANISLHGRTNDGIVSKIYIFTLYRVIMFKLQLPWVNKTHFLHNQVSIYEDGNNLLPITNLLN